jgi:hypothetical protein
MKILGKNLMKMENREIITEFCQDFNDETLLLDGFDDAFVGIVESCGKNPVACYNV